MSDSVIFVFGIYLDLIFNIVIGVRGGALRVRLQKAWYHGEQLGRALDELGM